MIKLFKNIEDINSLASELLKGDYISDYRIVLNYNNEVDVYIVLGQFTEEEVDNAFASYDDVNLNCYSQDDFKSSDFMESFIFEKKDKVNIESTRRRLTNLLNPLKTVNNEIPIVTFYSYKGGVGRSTTLASCASYLAMNNKKKIVILDCDFEAPGFTNFYLTDSCSPVYSNGLIEYFVDQ